MNVRMLQRFVNEQSIVSSSARSQMISQEDFSVISRLDSGDQASRDKVVKNALVIIFSFSWINKFQTMILRWQRRRPSNVPRLCTTFWATSARIRQSNTCSPLLMIFCRRTRRGLPFSGAWKVRAIQEHKEADFFKLWGHHLPKVCFFSQRLQ